MSTPTSSGDMSDRSNITEMENPFYLKKPEEICFTENPEKSLISTECDTVLIFGGLNAFHPVKDSSNNGRNIYRFVKDDNKWELVGVMPCPRHHHAVVACEGKVYIIGGTDVSRKDANGRSTVLATVLALYLKEKVWMKEGDMSKARKDAGAVTVDGIIYIIGGRDETGKVLRSVEKYDPKKGKWERVGALNVARFAAGVAYHNGAIWVAGGVTTRGATNTVETLSLGQLSGSRWILQPPLRYGRGYSSLVSFKNELYLIGGLRDIMGSPESTADVDVMKNDEWRLRMIISVPKHGHAVVAMENEMLVLGGVSTKYNSCLRDVEIIIEEGRTISRQLRLPQALSGHGAVCIMSQSQDNNRSG